MDLVSNQQVLSGFIQKEAMFKNDQFPRFGFHNFYFKRNISIEQVAAQEISTRLEKSQFLRSLNLSSIQLKHGDFMYLGQGLRLSISLKELNLADTGMDKNLIDQHRSPIEIALCRKVGIRVVVLH